jgi:chromosome segregation ATPase
MLALILVSTGLLVFAVTVVLLSFENLAALVALFSSLPASQQLAWLVICLAPPSLIALALLQHSRLLERSKAADTLEARLRGVRLDVVGLEQEQKDSDQATDYLNRSDPEGAISALQARITGTEHAVQLQQQHNQDGDLMGRVEVVRQQQHEIKQKLSEMILKRCSIEASVAQLQSSQDEMERTISGMEQNRDGDSLEQRLQKLREFIATTNARCEEIELSVPGLLELQEKFEGLRMRVAPLNERETGVTGVLNALSDARTRLAATIARLERDEGVSLDERIQQLTETKRELEERVSSVLAQFSAIETIHKDISGLFVKLNQAQRMPRELDAGGRVVAING